MHVFSFQKSNYFLTFKSTLGENMLVDNNDNLKLADFGLALRITLKDGVTRKSTQETTEWPKFAGTLLFAAPEVRANYLSRTTYGRKADVW